jgi:hypothetical protein
MKSLSELADIYEEWARANEATAEEIQVRLDVVSEEIRNDKRWLADWLTADAVELRTIAAELRGTEWRVSIN